MTEAVDMPSAVHLAGHFRAHMMLGTPDLHSVVGNGALTTCPRSPWSPTSYAGLPVPPTWTSRMGRPAARTQARHFKAWREIVGDLCGPVAEARWRSGSREAALALGDEAASRCFASRRPARESDLGRVRARLEWMAEPDVRASFLRAWREAEYLLANDWKRLLRVAALMRTADLRPGDGMTELWSALPARRVNADWLSGSDGSERPRRDRLGESK